MAREVRGRIWQDNRQLSNVLPAPGQSDDAIAHYMMVLDSNPDDAWAHINLGNLLQTRGRFDDAIAHYRRALDIDPGKAVVYNNLGVAILGAKGTIENSAARFEEALALKPDYA